MNTSQNAETNQRSDLESMQKQKEALANLLFWNGKLLKKIDKGSAVTITYLQQYYFNRDYPGAISLLSGWLDYLDNWSSSQSKIVNELSQGDDLILFWKDDIANSLSNLILQTRLIKEFMEDLNKKKEESEEDKIKRDTEINTYLEAMKQISLALTHTLSKMDEKLSKRIMKR